MASSREVNVSCLCFCFTWKTTAASSVGIFPRSYSVVVNRRGAGGTWPGISSSLRQRLGGWSTNWNIQNLKKKERFTTKLFLYTPLRGYFRSRHFSQTIKTRLIRWRHNRHQHQRYLSCTEMGCIWNDKTMITINIFWSPSFQLRLSRVAYKSVVVGAAYWECATQVTKRQNRNYLSALLCIRFTISVSTKAERCLTNDFTEKYSFGAPLAPERNCTFFAWWPAQVRKW